MGTGRIFINYRRDDSRADSGRLYDHLSARFPGKVFRDVGSLEPGVDWQQAIGRVIGQADACVVVIGCNWLNIPGEDGKRRLDDPQDTVRREIFAALQRDIKIFPVLVGGAKMPKQHELPLDLQPLCNRNALEITEQDWSECCAKLTHSLELALGVKPSPLDGGTEKKSSGRKWLLASAAVVLIGIAAAVVNKPGAPRSEANNIHADDTNKNKTIPQPVPEPTIEPQHQRPKETPAREVNPESLAGNWRAQVNSNGSIYDEQVELYHDHSFRVTLNGASVAVGSWQADGNGQLELSNATNFATGLHFSCGPGMNENGPGPAGSCTDRMNNSWSYTLSREGGFPPIPASSSRVDVSQLTLAERAAFLQVLASQRCTCGCGMSVQMCLQNDLTCNFSPGIARNALMAFMQVTRG